MEYRTGDAFPNVAKQSAESGQTAVDLAKHLLRAESSEIRSAVDVDHAAFLLGLGISASPSPDTGQRTTERNFFAMALFVADSASY
jgi:hypothetical protein